MNDIPYPQNLPKYGSSLSSQNTSRPTEESKLTFYEYKYMLNLFMEMVEFVEKNYPDGILIEHKEPVPYFIYHTDLNYLKKLIAKMKQRLREFEPEIIRTTTAHIGYYDV